MVQFHTDFLYNSYTVFFTSAPILHLFSSLGSVEQLAGRAVRGRVLPSAQHQVLGATAQPIHGERTTARRSQVSENSCTEVQPFGN